MTIQNVFFVNQVCQFSMTICLSEQSCGNTAFNTPGTNNIVLKTPEFQTIELGLLTTGLPDRELESDTRWNSDYLARKLRKRFPNVFS